MKKILILITSVIALAGTYALACDSHGNSGIVPENDMWISVDDKNASGITEVEFNEVIDRAFAIYEPIIKSLGKKLKIERKWNDGTVNAYAKQSGKTWIISMFGGLARHKVVTKDAFATVVCHELGHHLGGAPKKATFFGSTWASNEGQADYWGSAKCLKRFMDEDDNIAMMKTATIDTYVKEQCDLAFTVDVERAMCYRGALAGESLGNLFRVLRKKKDPIAFNTPDKNIVSKISDKHPASQCRLDTYFQGSLCKVDPLKDVDNKDANIGTCSRTEKFDYGLRPLCWFKPKS